MEQKLHLWMHPREVLTSMPPSMWAVLASPALLAAATAIAERSPKAQKNTTRRPVAAAT